MNISLEYYKVFYQAAATGSITMAAETLCISQPAVSQAVKHLERELEKLIDQALSHKGFSFVEVISH